MSIAPFKSAVARDAYLARHKERSARWPEPWVERMVPTTWGETYVRTAGPEGAPPLVLLPGVGSPSYLLAPQAFGLAPHFRLYAVDNIYDIGRSIASRPLVTADDFVAWLDELFGTLELSKPSVLGLSYGGWIFTEYALRRPERVARLVLLAPGGTLAPLPFGFIWRAVLTLLPGRRRAMERFADWASPGVAGDPRWAAERRALIDDALLGQASFARRRLVPPLPPSDDAWRGLAVPTLLMFGDREVVFDPKAAAERIQRLAPQIRLEVLPGVGHDFFLVAADAVNARVREFLAGGPSPD